MSQSRWETAHGVDRDRRRERVTLQKPIEPIPGDGAVATGFGKDKGKDKGVILIYDRRLGYLGGFPLHPRVRQPRVTGEDDGAGRGVVQAS